MSTKSKKTEPVVELPKVVELSKVSNDRIQQKIIAYRLAEQAMNEEFAAVRAAMGVPEGLKMDYNAEAGALFEIK